MDRVSRGDSVRAYVRALVIAMVVALAAMLLLLWASTAARAGELVPSVGLTRSVDSDETKSYLGVALRGWLIPSLVQSELGVAYRSEELFNGSLKQTMIPVTASLLLRPVPGLHADGGAGWYHTKLDYENPLLSDETTQEFGVHVGGGIQVPLAPGAALDMTGRYVFLEDQESKLVPAKFDPDFWTMTLGLALRF
jgi:opacity protein-like surface antigen